MKYLLALIALVLRLNGFGQGQVLLDPTGAGDGLLSNVLCVFGPNDYLVSGLMTPNGQPEYGWVSRLSKAGVTWSYRTDIGTRFDAAFIANNGDVIASGSASETFGSSCFIARFTAGGTLVWSKKLMTDNTSESVRSIKEAVNGNLMITGTRGPTTNRQQVVAWLSGAGTLLREWQEPPIASSQSADKVFLLEDTVAAVFGLRRIGGISTGDVSLRVVDHNGTETLYRAYGNSATGESFPDVAKTLNGFVITTSVMQGWGLITLDQAFNKVDASSRWYTIPGVPMSSPKIAIDGGGFLYLGGRIDFGGVPFAFVMKVDPLSFAVLWTRTLNANGFVTDLEFDGGDLVVSGSSGTGSRLSFIDSSTGSIIGTPCEPLPTFDAEVGSYPGLAEVDHMQADWINPNWSEEGSGMPLPYAPAFSTCEPIMLPIELSHFGARAADKSVILEWTTSTESGNDRFVVERSDDGETFEPVLETDGAGYSQTAINYSLVDENPYEGQSYYRLRQYDFDGTTSVSSVVSVYFAHEREKLHLYPNPVASEQLLRGVGQQAFLVFDSNGRMVYEGFGEGSLGLPSGLYLIRLSADPSRFGMIEVVD